MDKNEISKLVDDLFSGKYIAAKRDNNVLIISKHGYFDSWGKWRKTGTKPKAITALTIEAPYIIEYTVVDNVEEAIKDMGNFNSRATQHVDQYFLNKLTGKPTNILESILSI